MVNVSSKHLLIIKHILYEFAPDCEVRAFGSRVNGSSHAGSDLDLVIVSKEPLVWKFMAELKNAFTESNLPFEVDVLDWNTIPENFRQNIGKKFEVVQEGKPTSDI